MKYKIVVLHLVLILITNPISLHPFHEDIGIQSHHHLLKRTFSNHHEHNVLNKLFQRKAQRDSEESHFPLEGQEDENQMEKEQESFLVSIIIMSSSNLEKECQNLNDLQKNKLNTKVINNIASLQQKLMQRKKMDELFQIEKGEEIIQNKITYFQILNQLLQKNCSLDPPTKAVFRTNLIADNWILGNRTIDQILKQLKENMNAKNCPEKTPFYNGKQCLACQSQTYFNLDTKNCEECSKGKKYEKKSHLCLTSESKTKNDGEKGKKQLRRHLSEEKSKETNSLSFTRVVGGSPIKNQSNMPCPLQTPFFNGSDCINCTDPHFLFNMSSKTCTSCKQGEIFLSDQHICKGTIQKGTQQNKETNSLSFTRVIGGSPVKNSSNLPCPLHTPFFNGSDCINCTDPHFLFNMSSKTCTSCKQGEIFLSDQHICKGVILKKTQKVIQQNKETNSLSFTRVVDGTPVKNSSNIPCPLHTPFFNGSDCINCIDPQPIFNMSSKSCTSCSKGELFLSDQHICSETVKPAEKEKPVQTQPIIPINETNSLSFSRVVDGSPKKNSSNTPCPLNKPFFNGVQCINCFDFQPLFNMSSNTCTNCAEGHIFLSDEHNCSQKMETVPQSLIPFPASPLKQIEVPGANATNLAALNLTVGENPSQTSEDSYCPSQAPFYNGQNCIQCKDLFNFTSLTCTSCPIASQFDSKSHKCLLLFSKLSMGDWTSLTPFKTLQEFKRDSKEKDKIPCPQPEPFFDGTSCFSCQKDKYFNVDLSECRSCPSNTTYSADIKKCVSDEIKLMTNPLSDNLIFSGYVLGELEYIHNQNKEKGFKDCEAPTSYFNGIQCITCYDDYPYFDMFLKDCSKCEEGKEYDKNKHDCYEKEKPQNQTSLETMIAVAFSHEKTVTKQDNS